MTNQANPFDAQQEHLNAVSAAVDLAVREARPGVAIVAVMLREGGSVKGQLNRINETAHGNRVIQGSVIVGDTELDYGNIASIRREILP